MIVKRPTMARALATARICTVAVAAALVVPPETLAGPVVKETREGDTSVIRITFTNGEEKVYRIDLSQRHSPASKQDALLKRWMSYRLGAFVCFNTNQFSGSEICRASDPKTYDPQHLDVAGWVAAFKEAGMKYAVLTTRHTSGFLLWESATTDFDVASSGNSADVCGEFVKECRKQGLTPAFYYCLWGGKWKPDPNARAVILAQLYELATGYVSTFKSRKATSGERSWMARPSGRASSGSLHRSGAGSSASISTKPATCRPSGSFSYLTVPRCKNEIRAGHDYRSLRARAQQFGPRRRQALGLERGRR